MTLHFFSRRPYRVVAPGRALLLVLTAVLAMPLGTAIAAEDDEAWKEMAVQVPDTFSLEQLQPFSVSQGSSLTYGIDPQTLSLGQDGVVRYVMVARSASGALNALYDGIRCQSAEVKTYARWDNNRSAWNPTRNAEWKALSHSGATRPALVLATQGLCNGKTPNESVRKMLATLKTGVYLQR